MARKVSRVRLAVAGVSVAAALGTAQLLTPAATVASDSGDIKDKCSEKAADAAQQDKNGKPVPGCKKSSPSTFIASR